MLRLWSHPRLKELGFQLVLQARAAGAAGAAGTGAQSASVFGPRVLGRTLRRPSGSKGLLDGFSYGVVLSEFNPLKVRLTLSGSEMGQPNRALPVLGGPTYVPKLMCRSIFFGPGMSKLVGLVGDVDKGGQSLST